MRRYLTPRLSLLAIAHFTIDSYSSFLTPLLPLLVRKLDLSLTMVGTLVALSSMSSSLAQPLFGVVSDRMRRPLFVAYGPLAAAVFLSPIGLAPSYAWLVTLLVLGGLGVAAFHPQAAATASELSPRRGLAMSVFVTGGTLGFSLGPLLAVTVVSLFGLQHTWVAALPGLVVSFVLVSWLARLPKADRAPERAPLSALLPVWKPLTLLYLAVVSRSAVSFGFVTFLPFLLSARGFGVQAVGLITTLYLSLGALGGLLGGWLADRWGGRRVIVASFLGAIPLYGGFLFLPGAQGMVSLLLGSFALQASLPVNVVMGQELSPKHSSTISSLLMGAAWGLGALLIGPVGALADARGLQPALMTLATMLPVGLGCAWALPDLRMAAPPADLAQPLVAPASE